MQASPLVSIITATYNHELFIGQCIESVLAQDYSDWEQVIIDDGSTDRTRDIVAGYADRRITYLRQDNVGISNLAKTYNRAVEMSKGGLIAVLEGDDFWPPDKLQKQVPAFVEREVVLNWGKVAFVNSEGKVQWTGPRNASWYKSAGTRQLLGKMLFSSPIGACTVVCRRDVLLSVGGFRQADYTPYVDYPTWLELALHGDFSFTDEVLGYWRQHRGQMSSYGRLSMVEGKTRYAIDFFNRMPQDVAGSVGVTIGQLLANQKRSVIRATFDAGRIALAQRRWDDAKKYFGTVLGQGDLRVRLAALAGLGCARLKIDLEWLLARVGKPPIA